MSRTPRLRYLAAHILGRLKRRSALERMTKFGVVGASGRSEEHTSELQSHSDLVCRLLLSTSIAFLHTLSLHDALPISVLAPARMVARAGLHSSDPSAVGSRS